MGADLLSAIALFMVLSVLRAGGEDWRRIWLRVDLEPPWVVAVGYGLAWVLVLWLRGLYRVQARWSLRREAFDIASGVAVLAVVTLAALFIARLTDVSRLFLLILFPAQAALTLLSRAFLRRLFAYVRSRGHNARFVLVVGTDPAAQDLADRMEGHVDLGLRVIGHLAASGAPGTGVKRPVLGTIEEIEEILHSRVVDEVAICLPVQSWDIIENIARLCEDEGKIVRIPVPTLAGGYVEEFDGLSILSLAYGPDRAVGLALKRVLDLTVSVAALVVLSPLLAAISAWILVRDGRPILFKQVRVGLHGRPFTLLKFRTMVPDAEQRLTELQALNEVNGRAFKLTHDPRVTRTGRVLRASSLDELPQLWNVLLGEMSLVGPRPPLPHEVAAYDIWHRRRLSMKPGITGLWQVKARREQEFDRWVEIDLDYIDRWSLWLDLQIMLRTIPVMLAQQGR